MNILVTGGAGYIGGTVATILVEAGHNVTIVDNLCHSKQNQLPPRRKLPRHRHRRSCSHRVSPRRPQARGVLHFAALIEAGDSMKKPEVYFRNNTASTLSLLEAMHATCTARARLQFHGSCLWRA